jgi:DNA modification methylase
MTDAPSYIHESLAGLSVPIDSLNLDAANVRTHDDRNLDAIARSLDRWGQRQPIVVQREGMIVRAGNGRLLAAKRLGWTHMAALVVDEDSVEATAYAIADNRTGELAGWDEEGLVAMLQSIPDDLPDIGFTDGDLEQLIADLTPAVEIEEDEAPEPPADPVTRPGDLWTLGRHRVLCDDSLQLTGGVYAVMDGHRADAVVTDPPYAIYGSSTGVSSDIADDKMVIPFFQSLASVCVGNVKMHAHVYWCCDFRSWPAVARGGSGSGLSLLNMIVWDKKSPGMGSNYMNQHELVAFFAANPKRKTMASSSRSSQRRVAKPNIIRCPRVPSSNRSHNAAKPVSLCAELIRNSTDEGELVLDPFLGSGTTLIAAEQLGRTCYGMEISPAYCDVIVRRWEALTGSRAARVDSEGNEAGPMPEPQEAAVAAGG